uniref:Uncharacterized protein n=1 Tax=Anguilla anguilla TaxID=7936 RepID=A0A0E9QGV3_ANGAN
MYLFSTLNRTSALSLLLLYILFQYFSLFIFAPDALPYFPISSRPF